MRAFVRGAACAAVLAVAGAGRPSAQVRVAPHLGTVEVSGGALWSGGFDLGTRSAQETRNPGTGTGPLVLFETSNKVTSVTGAHVRIGFYLTQALAVEGGLRYLRPIYSASATNDFEQAENVVAKETMSRYVVDGSVVFHLNRLSFAGGRAVPFVSGGAGYLRELHQGQELIETGTTYEAGAGLKLWLGPDARRIGVRGDVGMSMRDGGFDFRQGRRTLPTAGISLAFMF